MKKFHIKLIGGTRITKWAKSATEALQQAEDDYPNQVSGIEDKSPFNEIEISKPSCKHEFRDTNHCVLCGWQPKEQL